MLAAAGSIWHEIMTGLRFLGQRRILFYLMLYAALINFLLAGPINTTTAYILTLTGSEAGSGMGLVLLVAGTLMLAATFAVYAWPRTRRVELELPDYTPVVEAGVARLQ